MAGSTIADGALHLVGYRDKTPTEAAAMRAAERLTLARLGVQISSDDARWLSPDGAAHFPETRPS